MQHMDKLGIRFKSAHEVQKFAELYEEFHNNTRMQCNRGYTPSQLPPAYRGGGS